MQFTVNSRTLVKGSTLRFIQHIAKEYTTKSFDLLDDELSEHLYWHPNFDPYNISPEDRFILSIDLAQGKDLDSKNIDSDYSVINIFRVVPNSIHTIKRTFEYTKEIKDCFRL